MPITQKQEARNILANVPQEYVFWCHHGVTLANLSELGDALSIMSDEDFAYHANSDKNDFTNWIKDIIKDDRLATDLGKATTRTQAASRVAARLAALRKRLA